MQDPAVALDVARRVRADASPMVRWDAVKVIAGLATASPRRAGRPDRSTVPILLELAGNDPDPNVRREAVKALAHYDEPRVIQALIVRIQDPSLSVAHAAREALVKLSAGVDLGMSRDAWERWWK
jgi:HEAT repeat protein